MRSATPFLLSPILIGLYLASSIQAEASPASPHPLTARDMIAIARLGSPRPSPDGRWIVFTQQAYDWDSNSTTINLWLASIDGKTLRPLTTAKAKDTSPRYAPDGKSIAFLSSRGGTSQVWTIDPAGGEAAPLTRLPIGVDTFAWSPDGSRLLFSAEVYPDCADLQCTADRDKAKADNPVKAMVFSSLPIRHWDEWEDGKRSHLFVWPLQGGSSPIDIMKGADADAPTKPFGGDEEFAWSPDGRSVAFTARMPREYAWSTNDDVYLAAADGSGFRCLSEANKAQDTQPVFSPDGKTLAWLSMTRPGYESDRRRAVLYDLASGRRRVLTEGWDRSPESLLFAPDGRRLIVTAEEGGRQKVFAVEAGSGVSGSGDATVATLIASGTNSAVALAGRDRLVFVRDSLVAPAEIYTSRLDGSDERPLTKVNEARMAGVRLSRPEEFRFPGAGGDMVQGWILRPVDFEAGRRYPVAFLIHGGPEGAWTDHFHYRWNMQAFAAAGYVTVAINFHGSTGFGQAFTDAINGDWGGKPYQDLMLGLDYVLATYPFADGTRVGALGASYGGYMINWIAGHTDRFRCLVSHDGELDLKGSYYMTEELWFPEWEFGGTPWEKPDNYERFSPESMVSHWKTPMLVVHGAKDFRLPETEGFSAFTALQRRGIPSKLLYFPDENHWVLKPRNSVLWHETVIGWLDQWLKGAAAR